MAKTRVVIVVMLSLALAPQIMVKPRQPGRRRACRLRLLPSRSRAATPRSIMTSISTST